MKTYGERRYSTTILEFGTIWKRVVSFSPGHFNPRETVSGTYWIGGWVSPGNCLEAVKKRKISFPCQELNPGRPGPCPSVYRLSNPVFLKENLYLKFIVKCWIQTWAHKFTTCLKFSYWNVSQKSEILHFVFFSLFSILPATVWKHEIPLPIKSLLSCK
jgi:hypothetical protein